MTNISCLNEFHW